MLERKNQATEEGLNTAASRRRRLREALIEEVDTLKTRHALVLEELKKMSPKDPYLAKNPNFYMRNDISELRQAEARVRGIKNDRLKQKVLKRMGSMYNKASGVFSRTPPVQPPLAEETVSPMHSLKLNDENMEAGHSDVKTDKSYKIVAAIQRNAKNFVDRANTFIDRAKNVLRQGGQSK
ncbi:MAG: hypothetical protein EB127_07590 [Alphaproteobacteria bacterium]|nr:hypothetical protein [Alphaproteobacteria bacterium]